MSKRNHKAKRNHKEPKHDPISMSAYKHVCWHISTYCFLIYNQYMAVLCIRASHLLHRAYTVAALQSLLLVLCDWHIL